MKIEYPIINMKDNTNYHKVKFILIKIYITI